MRRIMSRAAAVTAAAAAAPAAAAAAPRHRWIEIGANLLDSRFTRGKYSGSSVLHKPDVDAVVKRAAEAGLTHLMVTAGSLAEAQKAVRLVRQHNEKVEDGGMRMATTVGVHPTRTMDFEPLPAAGSTAPAGSSSDDDHGGGAAAAAASGGSGTAGTAAAAAAGGHRRRHRHQRLTKDEYLAAMDAVIADGVRDGSVVAVGECGLDYDRLFFSPKDVQLRHFECHFDLAERYNLPLFLHDRNTGGDFDRIIRKHRDRFPAGVVHSFTGSKEELDSYLDMGLYIGINGCSLKTPENLDIVKRVPLDRLMLETDAPWCDIRKTHASYPHVKTHFTTVKPEKYAAVASDVVTGGLVSSKLVNGRSEPCQIVQVAEVVAAVTGHTLAEVAEAAHKNSMDVFFSRKA